MQAMLHFGKLAIFQLGNTEMQIILELENAEMQVIVKLESREM